MTDEERRKAVEWFENRAKNCPMPATKRMYEIATEALAEPCSEDPRGRKNMTREELRAAAVATLTRAKELCRKSKCGASCEFLIWCGPRAPESLSDVEINLIADLIATNEEQKEQRND